MANKNKFSRGQKNNSFQGQTDPKNWAKVDILVRMPKREKGK